MPASDHDPRAALEARLRRLEDLEEIRLLYVDYGRHLDDGDFAAFASLFAREAKLRLGPVMRADGRAAIERVMRETLGARPAKSMVHVLAPSRLEVDGDTARGRCGWVAVLADERGGPAVSSVGYHDDDLVREDGRWRFACRRGFVDLPAPPPAG